MEIYAKGKNIPTFAFGNLFTEGECFADTITFYIERFYNGIDLADFSFLIKGVNENGYEAVQSLFPKDCGEYLALEWSVSNLFTVRAGKLILELRASNGKSEPDGVVVKYAMPPVFVNASLSGTNTVVPNTSEQLLSEIADAVSSGVAEIQETIDSFDTSAIEERLDNMDENIGVFLARPEVIPVTQEEYNAITHKENSLYVIIKEAE